MTRDTKFGGAVRQGGCMGTSKRQRRMDQRRGAILEDLEARVLLSHTIATLSRSLASASSVKDSPQYVLYAAAGSSTPLDTTGPEGFGPSTLLTAYGLTDVTGDGTGQTIAIVDAYNDPNIATDLHTFDAAYGLVNPTLVQINENGGTSLPGTDPEGRGDSWAVEISLDVEWAHAIAPGAKIVLVEASSDSDSDLMKAVNTARNYSGVSVVSLSWGGAESSTDTSSNSSFTTPSGHTGVTFVVSSGDDGAFGTGSSRSSAWPGSRTICHSAPISSSPSTG